MLKVDYFALRFPTLVIVLQLARSELALETLKLALQLFNRGIANLQFFFKLISAHLYLLRILALHALDSLGPKETTTCAAQVLTARPVEQLAVKP